MPCWVAWRTRLLWAASTEPHKAPLLGPAQLPWAGAGGRRRPCRNAPSQERVWEGISARCQALSTLSCGLAQKRRWPVPPAPTSEVLTALRGLLPQQPSPDVPREVQKKRARSSGSPGVCQACVLPSVKPASAPSFQGQSEDSRIWSKREKRAGLGAGPAAWPGQVTDVLCASVSPHVQWRHSGTSFVGLLGDPVS